MLLECGTGLQSGWRTPSDHHISYRPASHGIRTASVRAGNTISGRRHIVRRSLLPKQSRLILQTPAQLSLRSFWPIARSYNVEGKSGGEAGLIRSWSKRPISFQGSSRRSLTKLNSAIRRMTSRRSQSASALVISGDVFMLRRA